MKNKDTGEFELVVGDKQLLSGFFIGVVLLAVVFALGYFVGQSSPKSAKVAGDSPSSSPTATSELRPRATSAPEPTAENTAVLTPVTPDPAPTTAAPPTEAPPQPTTVPARDTAAASAPPSTPPPAKAEPEPANASYWQVTATASKNSADTMYQALKGQGFPVTTRPGPNKLTLVWVGPYTDNASLSHAKKQLEDAGFKDIFKKP